MATAASNAFSISIVAAVPGVWTEISVGLPGTIINDVRAVSAVPGQNKIVAVSGCSCFGPAARVWSSANNGTSWTEIGLGAGTQAPQLQPLGIVFDRQDANIFWVFGNFANQPSGGLLRTTDGGNTFTPTRAPEAEGVGVDFSDAQRRLLVIGAHEKKQQVFKATDGGQAQGSWTNIGTTLPGTAAYSEYPLVIDANTYLIGCSFTIPYGTNSTGGGTPGVYRTTNGGTSWSLVSTRAVFGTPLVVAGNIYWSFYDSNTMSGGILYSADNGQTWSDRTASSLLHTAMPIRLPSGKFASMNVNRFVVVSPDATTGSWTQVGNQCPIVNPSGLSFNSATNTFIAYDSTNGKIHRLTVDASAL
jgi:photosystem II stability/assembly factor-like uncharacterized protein